MRILVTGGAGLIGSHCAQRLAARGAEGVVPDKRAYAGTRANLEGAAGDLQVVAAVRTYGVNASITRGSNTYGPNQYPEKIIPLFITNALDGESLPVYGDGRQIRDWLHVEDHCDGVELVLREGEPGG